MTQSDGKNTHDAIKPKLARVHKFDIPDGGAISLDVAFKAGRQSLVIARRGDLVTGFINQCPHAKWPLDTFDGRFLFTPTGELICAAHSAIFDVVTGECLGGPGNGGALMPVELTCRGDHFEIVDAS